MNTHKSIFRRICDAFNVLKQLRDECVAEDAGLVYRGALARVVHVIVEMPADEPAKA